MTMAQVGEEVPGNTYTNETGRVAFGKEVTRTADEPATGACVFPMPRFRERLSRHAMNRFLKVALYSAAAAGAAFVGGRLMRLGTPQPSEGREPSENGDLAPDGPGAAGELTPEQREKLLEELEDQLGA
jgi:hypothetical protein